MRVRAITPLRVTEEELQRRQERYDKLSPPSLQIDVVNLPPGEDVPTSLGTHTACRASDHYVYEEAMRTNPAEYDAIFLDCVLDPALDELERDAPLPVFGILKLTASFLASLGHEFAAVTRNQVIGDELRARLEHYGLADKFHRLIILDLSFEDIADDSRWNASVDGALNQLEGSNVRSLINGCSAVDVHPDEQHSASVVDPTALALTLLGVAADVRLATREIRYALEHTTLHS